MLTFVLTGDHRIAESVRNLTSTQSYSYPFGNQPKGSLEAGKTSEWMYVNQTALVNFSGSDNKITRKVPLVTNNTIQGCTLTYGISGDLRRDSKDSIYIAVSGSKSFDKWADSLFCITAKKTITINDTLRGYMPYQPHRIYPIEHKEQLLARNVGFKQYELTDHLGNVRVVVGDVKAQGTLLQDAARILAYNNFYAFGMTMPGRTFNSNVYRYGFNGKEDDKETGYQDYGMRMYNPKLARFFSVDPITNEYPELTPYQFASNTPVQAIDLDGLEAWKLLLRPALWILGKMGPRAVGAIITSATLIQKYGTQATPYIARYGSEIGNFVYGFATDDPIEPFPSQSGVTADLGKTLRHAPKIFQQGLVNLLENSWIRNTGIKTGKFVAEKTGEAINALNDFKKMIGGEDVFKNAKKITDKAGKVTGYTVEVSKNVNATYRTVSSEEGVNATIEVVTKASKKGDSGSFKHITEFKYKSEDTPGVIER